MGIDFQRINTEALARSEVVLAWMLPSGRVMGWRYFALNPRREDKHIGSFSVDLQKGVWCDFALCEVSGGDLISLGAYIWDCRQGEAAIRIANYLNIRT
ncbi:MAG: hypothetical protein Q8O00_16930 [Holophaga sp.]|nr:hypothetical protein [Holophaga sp.]